MASFSTIAKPVARRAYAASVEANSSFPFMRRNITTQVEEPAPANPILQPTTTQKLSAVWKEVQGSNSWAGLTRPTMNPLLRSELLRYGDFVHICYDSFDSKMAKTEHKLGGCKYAEPDLFENARDKWVVTTGYKVTQYLYAETDGVLQESVKQSVWIGYIAVCDDEEEIKRMGRRDIVVAWRGTVTAKEWLKDLSFLQVKASKTLPMASDKVRIECGFLSIYTSIGQDNICARDSLHKEITRLVNTYQSQEYPLSITFAGHSLGSALATLAAYDVKESLAELLKDISVTVFGYGGPKVGNKAFADRVEKVGVKVLRVENKNDLVPKIPPGAGLEFSYSHAGVSFGIDNLMSPYLKPRYPMSSIDFMMDIFCVHDIGVYIHLIDCYQGEGLPFRKPTRNVRFLNISTEDIMKDAVTLAAASSSQLSTSKDPVGRSVNVFSACWSKLAHITSMCSKMVELLNKYVVS